MTAIAIHAITEQNARRLTERIRIAAVNYSEAKEKLMTLVKQAKEHAVHLTLGYSSWTAYLSEVLGEEPMQLARGERQEMVQMLSAEGMSTRAIAPIVGISQPQVVADMRSGDQSLITSAPVQGLDGKTYTRTAPQSEPERKPSRDVEIVNDIRLYLRHIATSPDIAGLTTAGKQHIIDALNNTINHLKEG